MISIGKQRASHIGGYYTFILWNQNISILHSFNRVDNSSKDETLPNTNLFCYILSNSIRQGCSHFPKATGPAQPIHRKHHMSQFGPETPASNMTSYADLMALEFVVAFRDLQKDATNHEKLASFVRKHYVNRLNGPEFASALTNKPGDDPLIVHNFFNDLSCHYKEHSVTLTTLKSMDESLVKRIDCMICIVVSKKVSAVFFMLAAMFFAATASIAAANANPKREAARPAKDGPALAAAAAAASILFGAVGKWIHSILNKRETAATKHEEITAFMIIGAKFGMEDLRAIHGVARRLKFDNKSMSETVEDGNDKVAAVKRGFEDLVAKVEAYSNRMNWCASDYYQTLELSPLKYRSVQFRITVFKFLADLFSFKYL